MPRNGERVRMATQPGCLTYRYPGTEFVEFTYTGDLLAVAHAARSAVIYETGHRPTHFLLGWRAYGELRLMTGGSVDLLGIPVYLDPTREAEVIAVPPVDAVLGRQLPAGAVQRLGGGDAQVVAPAVPPAAAMRWGIWGANPWVERGGKHAVFGTYREAETWLNAQANLPREYYSIRGYPR